MSELSNKAEINIDAAKKLLDSTHFCSSVHCSYYSCVQLMKHIIIHKIGMSEENISLEEKRSPMLGSHGLYINLTLTYLKSNVKRDDWKLFNDEIVKLKRARRDADYIDVTIDYDSSRFSYARAVDINKVLRKVA
jgi:hypothetical protein